MPRRVHARALVNYLALLGWSPGNNEEVLTVPELIERFTIEGINRAPGRFDLEKCAWLNQQHLAKLPPAAFAAAAKPFVAAAGLPADDPRFPAAATAVREKVRLLSEVPAALDFLLAEEASFDAGALAKLKADAAAATLLEALARMFRGAARRGAARRPSKRSAKPPKRTASRPAN